MKLLVNTERFQFPLRGVGTYLYNLLRGFHQSQSVDTILCFDGSDRLLTFEEMDEKLQQSTCTRKEVACDEGLSVGDPQPLNDRFRQLTEPHKDAVYLEPDCITRPFPGKSIPIIYDLSALRHPEFHSAPYLERMKEFLPRTMEQSAHVITVSEFTRGEVCSLWNVPRGKVSIVYPGVDATFKPRKVDAITPILEQYNIAARYLLVVGTLEPKKNLINLIAAYSRVPKEIRAKHPLVLVGARSWDMQRLEHILSRYEGSRNLVWLGYVDQKDLPILYSGAHGFVYTSVYEGFGISLLEAMASGIPILTSNQSAMPEIAEKVALLTDPLNLSSLTNNLQRLINDEAFRTISRKTGVDKAKNFTWSASVDQALSVLKAVNT